MADEAVAVASMGMGKVAAGDTGVRRMEARAVLTGSVASRVVVVLRATEVVAVMMATVGFGVVV